MYSMNGGTLNKVEKDSVITVGYNVVFIGNSANGTETGLNGKWKCSELWITMAWITEGSQKPPIRFCCTTLWCERGPLCEGFVFLGRLNVSGERPLGLRIDEDSVPYRSRCLQQILPSIRWRYRVGRPFNSLSLVIVHKVRLSTPIVKHEIRKVLGFREKKRGKSLHQDWIVGCRKEKKGWGSERQRWAIWTRKRRLWQLYESSQ